MNVFFTVFAENGVFIIPCILILIAVGVLAVSNAENCPYPDECFDCDNSSCSDCNLLLS